LTNQLRLKPKAEHEARDAAVIAQKALFVRVILDDALEQLEKYVDSEFGLEDRNTNTQKPCTAGIQAPVQ